MNILLFFNEQLFYNLKLLIVNINYFKIRVDLTIKYKNESNILRYQ